MNTSNVIDLGMVGSNNAETYFVVAPYNCHVEDVQAVSQDTGESGETVVVSNGIGGTTIGTATFSTDVAGELATYVAADADQEVDKDGVIQVVVSALGNSTDRVHVRLILDPFRIQS